MQTYSNVPGVWSRRQAHVLNCTHIFCLYCIAEWRKRKDECPICRQTIRSQTRCLPLDNFIDSMVQNLSADIKTRRQVIVDERKGERCVKRHEQASKQASRCQALPCHRDASYCPASVGRGKSAPQHTQERASLLFCVLDSQACILRNTSEMCSFLFTSLVTQAQGFHWLNYYT